MLAVAAPLLLLLAVARADPMRTAPAELVDKWLVLPAGVPETITTKEQLQQVCRFVTPELNGGLCRTRATLILTHAAQASATCCSNCRRCMRLRRG